MNMNRSNSFVHSLKWWPLQNSNQNNTNHNNQQQCNGINKSSTSSNPSSFGSSAGSVAVQKLRESKWFGPDEQRIFCAVIECGFIVEIKQEQENEGWYGVVMCKVTKEKKSKPDTIEIYSVKIRENGLKVFKMTLNEIWNNDWKIRINNFADKEKQAHCEKDIRDQISFARKARQSLWHNTKHFAYWCRYGNRQQDVRRRHMSECVKWGSIGMNAGMLLIMNNNRQKSCKA